MRIIQPYGGNTMVGSSYRYLLITAIFVLLGGASMASTLIVHQDGSGDFLTVGAALATAMPGDVIQVGPGTYPEDLLITIDLAIVSESGAEVTILDGEETHQITIIDGGCNVDLTGFTFTRAYASPQGHGGAILAWNGPTVAITDCIFNDNRASWDNGAVHARHSGTSMTITNCQFRRNTAPHNGGACGVHTYASIQIFDSIFEDNSTGTIAGACNAYGHGDLEISGCLFVNNSGGIGAVIVEGSSGSITGSTFHGNASESRASVLFSGATTAVITHSIVTSDVGGAGVEFSNCSGEHSCNIFYGNDEGDLVGAELSETDAVVDPQFCDYTSGDFTLCSTSPALPENNTCGLIGAFGMGCDECGPVATEQRTWSDMKGMFR